MKNNNIIIRIDDVLKKEFQNIISENGFTVSDVLIAFIKDVVKKKKLPLNLLSKLNENRFTSYISIPEIKKEVEKAIEEFKDSISKVYLFGDFALGKVTKKSTISLKLEVNNEFNKDYLSLICDSLSNSLHRNINLKLSDELTIEDQSSIKKEEICILENKK